jgi:hypothetical protein
MLASKALISVLTSTCTSGSQTCNGQIGYLIANIKNKRVQINIFSNKLSKKVISINVIKFKVLKCSKIIKHITIHKIELKELNIIK